MSKLIFEHTYTRYSYEDEDNYHLPTAWEAGLKWNSREDYLEWVSEWKARLKEEIAEIRKEKQIRRDKSLDIDRRNSANLRRQNLRTDCWNLLLLRKIGKIRSAKQRDVRISLLAA